VETLKPLISSNSSNTLKRNEITNGNQEPFPKNYLKCGIFLILAISMLLFTIIVCQYFALVCGGDSCNEKNGEKFLLIIAFTLVMAILKFIMNAIAGKLDEFVEVGVTKERRKKKTTIIFGYAMDLFYFFFYRSLFLEISRYEAFVPLAAFSLAFDGVLLTVRLSKRFYALHNEVLTNIPIFHKFFQVQLFESYQRDIVLQFFFRICAQFISLIGFTFGFVFVFYGWNRNFYEMPDMITRTNTEYNIPNVVVFITYLPISIIMELLHTYFLRRYSTHATGLDCFHEGVTYLKDKEVFSALFLMTIHIGQDVFLSRNKFNFCPDNFITKYLPY